MSQSSHTRSPRRSQNKQSAGDSAPERTVCHQTVTVASRHQHDWESTSTPCASRKSAGCESTQIVAGDGLSPLGAPGVVPTSASCDDVRHTPPRTTDAVSTVVFFLRQETAPAEDSASPATRASVREHAGATSTPTREQYYKPTQYCSVWRARPGGSVELYSSHTTTAPKSPTTG